MGSNLGIVPIYAGRFALYKALANFDAHFVTTSGAAFDLNHQLSQLRCTGRSLMYGL